MSAHHVCLVFHLKDKRITFQFIQHIAYTSIECKTRYLYYLDTYRDTYKKKMYL